MNSFSSMSRARWRCPYYEHVQDERIFLFHFKKISRGKNLLSWQSRPSGKQSFPVPLFSSRPQSSGNSLSMPVAWGDFVPSSTNRGARPKMFCTPRITGCNIFCSGRKKFLNPLKPNWASVVCKCKHTSRTVAGTRCIFMIRLPEKDWYLTSRRRKQKFVVSAAAQDKSPNTKKRACAHISVVDVSGC